MSTWRASWESGDVHMGPPQKGARMGTWRITFTNENVEQVEADYFKENGDWIDFFRSGDTLCVRIRSKVIERIDLVDQPS
jgi:hypothetical protein